MIRAGHINRTETPLSTVQRHRAAIAAACRRCNVYRLTLFGSATRPDFGAESDFDFVADFSDEDGLARLQHRMDLRAALEQLLQAPVDLLDRASLNNPELVEEIDHTEVPIIGPAREIEPYAADRYPMTDEARRRRRIHVALCDVREAGRALRQFTQGKTVEAYRSDLMLRSAVERQFIIIGEAINRVRKRDEEFGTSITGIPSIVAFRNLLVHNYDLVDDEVVWLVLTEKLPKLLEEVEQTLSALEQDQAR